MFYDGGQQASFDGLIKLSIEPPDETTGRSRR
jgi:hypothetical protein